MANEMIYVTSASDRTIVLNVPDIPLHRVWNRRGQKFPFRRDQLEMAYYNPSVEFLFREGILVTDDKQFLVEVGLMAEEEEVAQIAVDDKLFMRMIKLMPIEELKNQLTKLSRSQINELGEFAILHYTDLRLDRVEILNKVTGKDILKAIENYKASQEG